VQDRPSACKNADAAHGSIQPCQLSGRNRTRC
jgi:hypothetical protein